MRTKKIAGYQSQTWNSYTFNTPLWNCTKWSFDKKLLFSSGLLIHVQYLQQFQVKFVVINYMSPAESRVHQRLLKTLLWRPTRHVDLSSGFVTFKSISLLEILWFCWFSTPYFAIFSPWHSWVAWVTVLQRIRAIFFGIWSTWSATVGRACFPILVIFTWFCLVLLWRAGVVPKSELFNEFLRLVRRQWSFSYVCLKCYQWLEHRRLNMSFSSLVLLSDYSNKGLRIWNNEAPCSLATF